MTSIFFLALPPVAAPPNRENKLTATSKGNFNYYGFGARKIILNGFVGGKELNKFIPGKSVCNRDSTTSRCGHIGKQSRVYRFVRKSHERIYRCLAEGTHSVFVLTKNILSRPPVKEIGHSLGLWLTPPRRWRERTTSTMFVLPLG